MSIKDKAYIVGIYEHPTRLADDKTVMQLHAECAGGALADAGLTKNDIDGYFCAAGDTPGLGAAVDGRLSRASRLRTSIRPMSAARPICCRSGMRPRRSRSANARSR